MHPTVFVWKKCHISFIYKKLSATNKKKQQVQKAIVLKLLINLNIVFSYNFWNPFFCKLNE